MQLVENFFTELVFVKNRSRGAGANGKEYNPGRMSYETMLKKKRSVVTIKKKDKLCGARGHRDDESQSRSRPAVSQHHALTSVSRKSCEDTS